MACCTTGSKSWMPRLARVRPSAASASILPRSTSVGSISTEKSQPSAGGIAARRAAARRWISAGGRIGGRAAAPVQAAHADAGRQVAGDQGDLGLERLEVGLDRGEGLRALGVAGAEPAEPLAERDVDVDRDGHAPGRRPRATRPGSRPRPPVRSSARSGSSCSGALGCRRGRERGGGRAGPCRPSRPRPATAVVAHRQLRPSKASGSGETPMTGWCRRSAASQTARPISARRARRGRTRRRQAGSAEGRKAEERGGAEEGGGLVGGQVAGGAAVGGAHRRRATCRGSRRRGSTCARSPLASRWAADQSASARRSGWRVTAARPGSAGSKRAARRPPRVNGCAMPRPQAARTKASGMARFGTQRVPGELRPELDVGRGSGGGDHPGEEQEREEGRRR